jgi:hypothetical protein
MKNILLVINAFIHDFVSALWLAALLVVYWINTYSAPSEAGLFILRLKKNFFYIGIGSLIMILFTGLWRMLTYRTGELGEEIEKKRKTILIIKHIIGFAIYGAGTYWLYIMVYG